MKSPKSNNEWMSISDMMSGLMLVFLFIAIGFMIEVESQKEAMRDVAKEYRDAKVDLNEALFEEFENDLQEWNATITNDNRIVFNAPEVLFEVSSSEVTPKFQQILDQFFPNFIKVVTAKQFKDEIVEVRIEGHTSAMWKGASSPEEIYLNNMHLSQDRAFSVLEYCYKLENQQPEDERKWLEEHLRANGMAFSKLDIDNSNTRRVEFAVIIKSESKIYKILQ